MIIELKAGEHNIVQMQDAITRRKNVLNDVHIAGFISDNGYSYSKAAYKNAVQLYEGASVYINHSYESDLKDKFGYLKGVYFKEESGLWAKEFVMNEAHPMVPQVLWWADNAPNKIGFSQVVTVTVPTDSTEADAILRVRRVDLVADPATVKHLFENKQLDTVKPPVQSPKEETMDLSKLDIKTLQDSRPDLVELITNQATAAEREFSDAIQRIPEICRTDAIKQVIKVATKENRDAIIADLIKVGTPVVATGPAPVVRTEATKKTDLTADELRKTY